MDFAYIISPKPTINTMLIHWIKLRLKAKKLMFVFTKLATICDLEALASPEVISVGIGVAGEEAGNLFTHNVAQSFA